MTTAVITLRRRNDRAFANGSSLPATRDVPGAC
jgi:hypothetical protein